MKKSIIVFAMASIFSAAVNAEEIPEGAEILKLVVGGDGCKDPEVNYDLNRISVNYEDYVANSSGDDFSSKACSIMANISVPEGYKVSLESARHLGFVNVPKGGIAKLDVRYFFVGNSPGVSRKETWETRRRRGIEKPISRLDNLTDLESGECGKGVIMRINITAKTFYGGRNVTELRLGSNDSEEPDFIANLKWEACGDGDGDGDAGEDDSESGGDNDNGGNGEVLVNANFNSGNDGFTFKRNRTSSRYAKSSNNSGAIQISVGGGNNLTVRNMQAGWSKDFTTTSSGPRTISVDAKLTQASGYESNEKSIIGVFIDRRWYEISSSIGDGNGGSDKITSTSFSKTVDLQKGSHRISLVCFNNLKTTKDEITLCEFDDLIIK